MNKFIAQNQCHPFPKTKKITFALPDKVPEIFFDLRHQKQSAPPICEKWNLYAFHVRMTCHAYAVIINQQTDENRFLYTGTQTHTQTHCNQFTHNPRIWIRGTVTPPYVILFRPYRLSEAIGYRYLVPDTSCPIWNERDFTSVNLVFTARIFDFSERESVMNVYFKSVGTKNPWSKMLFFEHWFST